MLYFALLIVLLVTFFTLYSTQLKNQSKYFRFALHILFMLCAYALMAHLVPGIINIQLIDDVKFSYDSVPYSTYLNFDKSYLGIVILLLIGFGSKKFNYKLILKAAAKNFLLASTIVMLLALSFGFVRWDVKFHELFWIWALKNLFLTCMAEEAFYRRYVQGGLEKLLIEKNKNPLWAIVPSALIFGIAHYTGGFGYVILSTIAGGFYGYAYATTGRVEAAILTHFGLNLVHFLFFSYPSL